MKISRYRYVIVVPLVLWLSLPWGCQKKGQEGITEEEAKAVGDQFIRARNEANLDLLDETYSPGVVVHDPSQPEDIVGLDSLKKVYQNTHAAVPDVKFSLGETFVKGDKAAWVFTMSGTVTGPVHTPVGDLPPTGKAFRFSGVAIDRIVGGKVVEEWVYFNPLDILQPIGFTLTPPQPPRSD